MHKIVNGIRVELTPEEEAQIQESWKRGAEKDAAQAEQRSLKEERVLRTLEKLASVAGVTVEEIKELI